MRLTDFVAVSNYSEGGIIGEYNKQIQQVGLSLSVSAGQTVLVTPGMGKAIQLFRLDMTTMTVLGETQVSLGTRVLFNFLAPKIGSMYGGNFASSPITGGIDEALSITFPTNATACVNVSWLEV